MCMAFYVDNILNLTCFKKNKPIPTYKMEWFRCVIASLTLLGIFVPVCSASFSRCPSPPSCGQGFGLKNCACVRCLQDQYWVVKSGLPLCGRCTETCSGSRNLKEVIPCGPTQNRVCHCDRGFFCESKAQFSCRRCQPCPAQTFSSEISTEEFCRPYTDCTDRGLAVISNGTRTRDQMCAGPIRYLSPRTNPSIGNAETTQISTSEHAETTQISTPEHAETTQFSTSEHAETTQISTSEHAETTQISTSEHAETTQISTYEHAETTQFSTYEHAVTAQISTYEHAVTAQISTYEHAVTAQISTSEQTIPLPVTTHKPQTTSLLLTVHRRTTAVSSSINTRFEESSFSVTLVAFLLAAAMLLVCCMWHKQHLLKRKGWQFLKHLQEQGRKEDTEGGDFSDTSQGLLGSEMGRAQPVGPPKQQVAVDHTGGGDSVSNTVGSIYIYSPGMVVLGANTAEPREKEKPPEEAWTRLGTPHQEQGPSGLPVTVCAQEEEGKGLSYPIPATGK